MASLSKASDKAKSLARVSAVLNELSREVHHPAENPDYPIKARTSNALFPDGSTASASHILKEAQRLYDTRQRWLRAFGENRDLLHDPALDILLYIFIATRRHADISVSSAYYAANVPQTTGLRYIALLCERGLLRRTDDPFDRRRHLLELTEAGETLICRCLVKP